MQILESLNLNFQSQKVPHKIRKISLNSIAYVLPVFYL